MNVILDPLTHVDSVAMGVWIGAGSRDETEAQNGLAHLLEHMAFKGTTSRSALDIAETIESVGGHMNAYTGREQTAYYLRLLKDDIPLGVDILADVLQNSTFLEEELLREKAVVIQEIGQVEDTPDDIIFDHFSEKVFNKQALGRPILGTRYLVDRFQRQDIMQFVDSHYAPPNMVFSISGALDVDKTIQLIEAAFQIETQPKTKEREENIYIGGEYRKDCDLEQAHVVLGFEGIDQHHPLYYAFHVFSTLFGGGMSSRLFQEVREKQGLAYSVYSFQQSYQDTGVFGIYGGTNGQDVTKFITTCLHELQKVPQDLSEKELNRAKMQLKASLLMGRERVSNRAEAMATQYLTHGRVIPSHEIIQKVEAVSSEDINNVIQHLAQTKMPSLALMGPVQHVASHAEIFAPFLQQK